MTALNLIGYWIESLNDNSFLPPQEFVHDDDSSLRDIVANYLDSGIMVAMYRGLSWCRFCRDRQNGCRELSDGYWIWPEGLSHYVRDHNVKLPHEFITDAVAGRPSDVMAVENRFEAPVDFSFWKEWCTRNRSGSLRAQLKSARMAVDRDVPRIVAEATARIVADDELRFGVSDSICLWEGCKNFARRGSDLCGSCIARCLDKHQDAVYEAYFFGLQRVLDNATTTTPVVGTAELG
jgi:hypothetical protein